MPNILRQATAADAPGIWGVRYSVSENMLTHGRLSDEDLRSEIEDTGRGWVIDDDGQIKAFAIGNARSGRSGPGSLNSKPRLLSGGWAG